MDEEDDVIPEEEDEEEVDEEELRRQALGQAGGWPWGLGWLQWRGCSGVAG